MLSLTTPTTYNTVIPAANRCHLFRRPLSERESERERERERE